MKAAVHELPVAAPAERREASPVRRFVAEFAESPIAVAAAIVFAAVIVVAVFCPYFAPTNPYDLAQLTILDSTMPPGSKSMAGLTFLLGSDGQGRDMLSGIFYGLRTSLFVGVTAGILGLAVGMVFGLISAYFGGRVDSLIMRVVDLQLSFPSILVALILLAILGQGVDKIIVALVVAQWSQYCRVVRASGLVERSKEYMEAAHCLALGRLSVLFRHLLPNCLPPLIVFGTVQIAHAITLEATLSFLGLGLPPTEPSLGLLIANGFEYMLSGRYWISFYPGIALLITIVSINLMGDQLRDVLNPRLRR